jgi:hypothetical protein
MKHIKLFEDFRSESFPEDRAGEIGDVKEKKPDLSTIGDCISTFEECMMVIDDIINEDIAHDNANYDIEELKNQANLYFSDLYKKKVVVTINDLVDFIDEFEESNK